MFLHLSVFLIESLMCNEIQDYFVILFLRLFKSYVYFAGI